MAMTPYRNLNGDSGIEAYDAMEDSIHVVFRDGAQRNFLYTHARPGKAIVDRMKALADEGRGLAAYIANTVKQGYACKW